MNKIKKKYELSQQSWHFTTDEGYCWKKNSISELFSIKFIKLEKLSAFIYFQKKTMSNYDSYGTPNRPDNNCRTCTDFKYWSKQQRQIFHKATPVSKWGYVPGHWIGLIEFLKLRTKHQTQDIRQVVMDTNVMTVLWINLRWAMQHGGSYTLWRPFTMKILQITKKRMWNNSLTFYHEFILASTVQKTFEKSK